jgi:hypothetical protein
MNFYFEILVTKSFTGVLTVKIYLELTIVSHHAEHFIDIIPFRF